MANDNVIDELSLQIDANANAAIKNLSRMQTQLRHLAKDLGSVSSATSGLARLTTSFNKIGNINTSKLNTVIGQLERISNINFKNIDGKRLNLDVKISGADKAEREIYAMQDAVKHVDVSPLVKKFNDLFGLKGVDATNIKRVYQAAVRDMASGGTGNSAFVDWLSKVDKDGLKIAKASFASDIASMRTEYAEFLKYLQNNKISLTRAVDKKAFRENTTSNEQMSFFSQSGSAIDGRWEELVNLFPTIMSGIKNVANEEDQVYAILEKIREARAALQTVNIKDISGVDSDNAWANLISVVGEAPKELKQIFDQEVQKSMKESASKIPLDISIEPSRIEAQIRAAIKQATATPFKLPLEFSFADLKSNLKSTVSTTLSGLDANKLGELNTGLSATADAMKEMGQTDPKSSGLTAFVNSINRLTSTDLSKFNLEIFKDIREAIRDFASMEDISGSVNRFVSSLARLANAGSKSTIAVNTLPQLGTAIKSVMGGLSSMGGLPAELNAFVGSIAQLANAGNKTGQTSAQLIQLGESLKTFITDISQAPEVSQNILQMTTAIANLAQAGGKAGTSARSINNAVSNVGRGSNSAANRLGALRNIVNDLGNVFKRAGSWIKSSASKIVSSLTSIRGAGLSLNGATSSIKNMIGALIGFRGITGLVNLGKQVMELGGNLTEIDHIVESVFGDMAQYVDTWSKTAIEKFGIASQSAKQYAGTLSAMFQASGLAQKDAGIMGVRLTELAGDLSAFYNIDTETAFKKIQSGMAGMVRPLRDLGIDLTAATLQEYAQAQGITTKYNAMTQAEKVMLRYNYLMHATELQSGDFERTNKSLANSLRTLKAYLSEVGTQIGVGLASAIRHVVVWLNTMMKYLVKGATAFATFMQTIFGKYKGGASGMAFDASSMTDDTSELEDAANGTASGLEDADEAAKKLKKDLSVLPFDELNQLNKDRESTSSSKGSGSGGGAGALGDLGKDLLDWSDLMNNSEAGKLPDAISDWAERCKAAFEKGDWDLLGAEIASGINDGLKKLYKILDFNKFKEKVDPFITGFTSTFNSLVKNVNWELLGKTVGEGINDIVYAVNRLLKDIKWEEIGSAFAEFANGLVNKVNFGEIGKLFGNKFMILWNTLYGFAKDFKWDEFGKKLGAGINGLNGAISWTTVAKAMTTSLNGLFTTLSNFSKTVHWDDIAKNITDGINTFIKNFKWKENGEALGDFIGNLCDTLISIIEETNWEDFGKGLAEMLQQIPWSKILKVVGEAIMTGLGGILSGLSSTPAGSLASGLIKALIAFKIGSALLPFANNIVKAFTGKSVGTLLAGGVSNLMSSFAGQVTAGFPTILSAVSGGLSSIVSGIGSAVTAIGGALAAIGPTGWIIIAAIAGAVAVTVAIVKHWGEIKEAAGKLWNGIKSAWDSIKTKTKETWDDIKGGVKSAWDTVSTTTSSVLGTVESKASTVWGNIENKITTVTTNAQTKVASAWNSIKTKTSEAFSGVESDVKTAWQAVSTKTATVVSEAYKKVSTNWNNIKTVTSTAFDAISTKTARVWGDVKTTVDSAITNISQKMSSSFSSAAERFKSTLESISEKVEKKFGSIKDSVDKAFGSLKSTFGTKWSLDISNTKPHIPVPHFEKSGSFSLDPPSIPTYRFAGWWKKGGLFKGGSGQVIGVAEAGRDEAVLPLEDSRAMATIGNAIARASGDNFGISKDDITDAVVMAMAMNPQSQEIIVNAVLKMENDEVLARHVERGKQKLDSRYNPVAQY